MSALFRASSAPSSSREAPNTGAGTRNTKHSDDHFIPDELLAGLTSTVCSGKTLGHSAHHRQCKVFGIRRPDAVWHHPLGRRKYKYFLEQPTSLTGAGRDISFLCDTMVTQKKTTQLPPLTGRNVVGNTQSTSVSESLIPEEYHIVKNRGLRCLELYEDAFTVQLQDEQQRLRVFPSLRPSGRLEVIQLMRMMDDMLEKAGVDQQSEELTELSQMEGLLQMVQAEQNIYNIVFHELIRQVSVGCAERGQLLAKLRQRYQSLLEQIPHRLKALHTEVVAQRALDRQLTEEIHRIKTNIHHLSAELSRISDHDAFVSQEVERARQQLAQALNHTQSSSDVVQGYHELYELQRTRLEAQLIQMTEERDSWSQLTLCIALKVISVKKLELVNRLHVTEQSWLKTAEHCSVYINVEDTKDLNAIVALTDSWREQLTAFVSRQKKTEEAQREQFTALQQGISKWLTFCSSHNKRPDLKPENASLESILADFNQWSDMLTQQCEHYQGEEQLYRQQTLGELAQIQERWLDMSSQLFGRHPDPQGELLRGQEVPEELDRLLSEHHNQLQVQVLGEGGMLKKIISLLGLLESWVSKLAPAIGRTETVSGSDWLKLENELSILLSLAEQVLQTISTVQMENQHNSTLNSAETGNVLDKVQEFTRNLSSFIDCERQRLIEEIGSIHSAQTKWMLDLLLLMVPDHGEIQVKQEEHMHVKNISSQTLDENGKAIAEKLEYLSRYISSSCQLIVDEQVLQDPSRVEAENEMKECGKLQKECSDWTETCAILLSAMGGGSVEETDSQDDRGFGNDDLLSAAEPPANEEVSAESILDSEARHQPEAEPGGAVSKGRYLQEENRINEGELTVCENPVVNLIGFDGNIMQKQLGRSSVRLSGTEELVDFPGTDEAQKAFSNLSTVGLLQQELHDSERRLLSAEQRALEAEVALQAALERINDLERQLRDRPAPEPRMSDEKEKPPPSPPPSKSDPVSPKKTSEAKAVSSSKKTKKRESETNK